MGRTKIDRIYKTQEEIKEEFGYDVFTKYENMCYKLALEQFHKTKNSVISFDDLHSEAWAGCMLAHTTYEYGRKADIKTHVYNTIYQSCFKFAVENIYSVKVPYVIHSWANKAGYNLNKYRELMLKYDNQLENGLINKDKYDDINEDIKKILAVTLPKVSNMSGEVDIVDLEESKNEKRMSQYISRMLDDALDAEFITKKDIALINKYLGTEKGGSKLKVSLARLREFIDDSFEYSCEDMKEFI